MTGAERGGETATWVSVTEFEPLRQAIPEGRLTLEFSVTWVNKLSEPASVEFSITVSRKNPDTVHIYILFLGEKA